MLTEDQMKKVLELAKECCPDCCPKGAAPVGHITDEQRRVGAEGIEANLQSIGRWAWIIGTPTVDPDVPKPPQHEPGKKAKK